MLRGTGLDDYRIHAVDIQRRIDRFADIATTRLAYSDEDKLGRKAAMDMMSDVGLRTQIDAAGNIHGQRQGTQGLPAIAFGSHIDTVRDAGRFDGVLGVVGAIECIRVLEDFGAYTRHPLEVIVFANEEGQTFGGLCGSRSLVGDLKAAALKATDASGRTLADAMRFIGGTPEALASSVLKPGDILAFVELHIEQGGELEALGVPIGIVEGITGILHSDLHITGVANHSGTTAMERRLDALVAAAEFVLAVRKCAADLQLCRVATVGSLTVSPNSDNIVPGDVELVLEIRDMQVERIANTSKHLKQEASDIARRCGVEIKFVDRTLVDPIRSDPRVLKAIADSCALLELPLHVMPSGAGHDAQMMARVAPMGMIFVPSVGGISHSPREFTKANDCAHGATVLLHTILELDQMNAGPPPNGVCE